MTTIVTHGPRRGGVLTWVRALALGLAVLPFGAQAQLVLSSAAPKTETFDGLGSTATASLPAGFKFSGEAAPTYASTANYTATTAAANGNNFTTGATYNFGTATTSTDRAVGFLNSGSYTTPRHILLAVSNTSGSTIQDLNVQFGLEKYRSGTREYNWTFYTSPDGVTWTAQTAGAQNYPADANNTVYSYPPLTTTKTVALTGVSIASGATYYLRWTQQGVGGSTNAQGAGLDDVTLTPTLAGGPAPAPTPAASIATGSVAPTSFCVTSAAGSAAFSVPFTSTGTGTGTYQVQLSDASGAFASTGGASIGSGGSSPLAATIPAGTASGTHYRVRVVNDATTGTDNGADLTVSLTATSNPVAVAPGATQTITTTGSGALLTATATLSGSSIAWQYGTSAAGPYTALVAGSTYQVRGADFPGAGTYYVVATATATTGCGSVTGTSDPVVVTVTAPATAPVVTVAGTPLADFGSVAAGSASLLKSFTVSGVGLTGNLTITPPAGFEIRTGATAFACCALTLAPSGGTLPSTTIEVRFVPTAAQAYQAAITLEGSGQPTQAVAVAGTGIEAVYPATLSTAPVTALAATTATVGGTIAPDGGSAVTARGVVWGKTANPTTALTTKTADGAGVGTFASSLTGLVPGTPYFVRAYATNGVGTTYGNELSFTTVAVPLADEPTAPATIAAGTLTGTSIQLLLGGASQKRLVLAHLGSAVDATPTDATTYTANPAFGTGGVLGTGNYVVYNGTDNQVTVTGLRPSTPYYFTVFAFNDNNTPYAENYLVTTPGTLSLSPPTATAALLLEENFDYAAGTLLTANGWTAHSGAGTNSVAVVAANLTQTGYGPNSGNAAALVTSGEDVSRQFAPVYARTPAYAAFLVKVSNASTTADYFFHFGPQTLGSTFRARVFVRKDAATGKVQFGISGGTGVAVYTTSEYDLNSTNLVVVKYTFDETGNTSQLFLNPTTATEPTAASATQTETGTSPAAPNDNIGTVALRQGTNSPSLVFDGLRVGTSYQVVTGLASPPATATLTRLHAGGGALATSRGAFAADQYYSVSSQVGGTAAAIAGTPDQALYQSERYSTNGTLSYAVPVANGQYQVVLHFAELYWTQPGQRVFNASLEGTTVLDHYDIVQKVGPLAAITESFPVTVTDGVLNLDLRVPYESGGADQAKLAALEIIPVMPTYRLRAGGGALATTTHGSFAADQYYSASSQVGGTAQAIASTLDPALYQQERYSTNGTLSYALPVANGQYAVVLHFAELYWTQAGQRVFDINLEGSKVLGLYDIVQKVGPRTATTETFTTTVTDGVLNLDLRVPYESGGADQAKLAALEVLQIGGTSANVAALASPNRVALASPAATAAATSLASLSTYPNPSPGAFTLTCTTEAAQTATLLLTDPLGRVLHQQAVALQAGENQVPVRTANLPEGLYRLTLRLANGQYQSKQVAIRP